ncbi:MAG: phosphocholine cytidylyltransferase family protein [candidate division WOR-3 bacterium]
MVTTPDNYQKVRPRVIILAAGVGKRLYPLTKTRPKCLLQIGKFSILEWTLSALAGAGVKEVLIVTGHQAPALERTLISFEQTFRLKIRPIFNPYYAHYNNSYSLLLALREHQNGDFVLYNSDVLVGLDLIYEIIATTDSDFLVIDEKSSLGEEAMKVKTENNRIIAIGKELDPAGSDGEYIGIAKFSADGCRRIVNELDRLGQIKDGYQQFYEAAIAHLLPYYPIKKFSTNGASWIEIDSFADLNEAKIRVLPEIEMHNIAKRFCPFKSPKKPCTVDPVRSPKIEVRRGCLSNLKELE